MADVQASRSAGTLRSRHQASVDAEVRRLERRLRAIGPMPRKALAKTTRADRWREGSFEEAVREGIRQGRLRDLPLGWIEARATER